MSTPAQGNLKLALSFIDGFNAHDLSSWAAQLADDFTAEYPGAPSLNREVARLYNEAFLPAFPDIHFDVIRTIANGDCVVTHWTATGTHSGPLATMSGQTIPPTNRRGTVRGVLITEIKDGKIASERTYWDQVSLLTQLGLMPGA